MRNTTHFTLTVLAMSMLVLAGTIPPSSGQDLDELQARFRARYAQLLQFKRDGKIGETFRGEVEAVDSAYLSDPALKTILNEENKDRQALYATLAKEGEHHTRKGGRAQFAAQLQECPARPVLEAQEWGVEEETVIRAACTLITTQWVYSGRILSPRKTSSELNLATKVMER